MAMLEITLQVAPAQRPAAAGVYTKYRKPFLDQAPGATSKQLLIRDEDVQVLHGFASIADATAYLSSDLFTSDVVGELSPLLDAPPEVRIYDEARPPSAIMASRTGHDGRSTTFNASAGKVNAPGPAGLGAASWFRAGSGMERYV
jgi:hypothetical protein